MALYDRWCDAAKEESRRKRYWTYTEKAGGRNQIADALTETVRSHYDRLENIARQIERAGYQVAARTLQSVLPATPKARSGDLGEILGTELVEEELGLRVPVRRLRYKDGREMALRGDDFIGVALIGPDNKLRLLKGEAKSKRTLGRITVAGARKVLDRDNGRCTPSSLLFVANRLVESPDPQDVALGDAIRDEVGAVIPRAQVDHMLFTFSGNGPHASLKADYEAASTNRDHYVVNVHVEDHPDFIGDVYERVIDLGKP